MANKRPGSFSGPGPGPSKKQPNDEREDDDSQQQRPGLGASAEKKNTDIPAKYRANFIKFQKSGESQGYMEKEKKSSEIPDLNLRDHISFREIQAKQKFLKQLLFAANKKQAERRQTSETDLLSNAVQLCKTNPKLLYMDIGRIDKDDYPQILQGRKLPSSGFICEIRVQGIFCGLGFSVSKVGSKDRAAENVLKILRSSEVCVLPMQRRWRDKNYPEFVLCPTINARKDLPPFYHPPEGSEDHVENFSKAPSTSKQASSEAPGNHSSGFQNIAHMGPRVTNKPLENFTIMLTEENAVCVMNSSSQFSKMAVDYYYEKPNISSNDFIVTLFIEGIAIADAKGNKKALKQRVTESALQCLNKFCHTVVTNKDVINTYNAISRDEMKWSRDYPGHGGGLNPARKDEQDGTIGGVGAKMMKMMGWTEGGGIGDRYKIKRDVIKVDNESINREGLGSKAIDSDKINREEAEEIVKHYAASNRIDDLVFASELDFDERMEIRYMAKRYNLAEKLVAVPCGRGKRVFLVLSKKLNRDAIIQKLEKDGQFGKYQLIRPSGGDRSIIKAYLNHQHLRKTRGFPDEVRNAVPGSKNWVQWEDPKKTSSNQRATTFDAAGRLKTFDERSKQRISSAMQCMGSQGGPNGPSMAGLDSSWCTGGMFGNNREYGQFRPNATGPFNEFDNFRMAESQRGFGGPSGFNGSNMRGDFGRGGFNNFGFRR